VFCKYMKIKYLQEFLDSLLPVCPQVALKTSSPPSPRMIFLRIFNIGKFGYGIESLESSSITFCLAESRASMAAINIAFCSGVRCPAVPSLSISLCTLNQDS